MSLSITDLKKGTIFEYQGQPYKVIDYSQKVMGRGGSIVNVRIKSLIDNKLLEKTFKGNEQIGEARVTFQNVQFLYGDSTNFYFMNGDTFEQFEVSNDLIGDNKGYLKEGDQVILQFFENKPINVELSKNVPLKVIYTEDAVKGDTSSAITKNATLETGIILKVPAFIKKDDIISIDTITGAYEKELSSSKNLITMANQIPLLKRILNDGLIASHSQADKLIKLSKVTVDGKIINDSNFLVNNTSKIALIDTEIYVSRAAYKLESVVKSFKLDFRNKKVLDVGSSTGGFTDYSIKNGASQVFAVEIGSNQMRPQLKGDSRIELYEKTDIRDILPFNSNDPGLKISFIPDIVLLDLSFISIQDIILPLMRLVDHNTKIILLVKPQFETTINNLKNKGIIKNETIRRQIFKNFELWVKDYCLILDKSDSKVEGQKGNLERFYLLKKL